MQPMYRRDAGVWHQTRALLYKNLLIKWRTKQQSLQVISFQKTDTRRLLIKQSEEMGLQCGFNLEQLKGEFCCYISLATQF